MRHDLRIFITYVQLIKRLSKNYFLIIIVSAIVQTAAPLLNIFMLRLIIDELTIYKSVNHVIAYLTILVVGNLFIGIMAKYFSRRLELINHLLMSELELELGKKIMNVDFKYLEDSTTHNLREQVMFFINNKNKIVDLLTHIIQSTVGILAFLFVILTMDVLIVVLVIAVILVNGVIYERIQKREFEHHQGQVRFNRKWSYYIGLAINFVTAKDIRIYNMSPLILSKTKKYHDDAVAANDRITHYKGRNLAFSSLIIQLQNIVIYAYAAYQAFKQYITIGQFALYLSSANTLSNHLTQCTRSIIEFRQMCKHIANYVSFTEIPEPEKGGSTVSSSELTLEFRNVSFTYNENQPYLLRNVSLVINQGEKLAIVGQNGAGKTTFIKLLCRLYKPQEGEILLGGRNIEEYDYDEYMKQISVVFQDFKLFPFSIKENLYNEKNQSEQRIEEVMKQVGLMDKVDQLPNRLRTTIYKTLDKDGVELSGGQLQKLAIARNILKEAPILILDEPTASLDPYAEAEIYEHFNELAKKRTTIYISHRMSSCKFCDKVVLFEKGEIVEYGTHEELVANSQRYAEMWRAQAQYYVGDNRE